MNPEEIPQMLRDIADTLEQVLGGGQGAPAGEAGGGAPDLGAILANGGGQEG